MKKKKKKKKDIQKRLQNIDIDIYEENRSFQIKKNIL